MSPSTHIHQQSAAHAFTICWISGIFAVTVIWIVQNLLATAIVSSRLDYCNSLLYRIADIDLTRLQGVQNWLALLVTKSPPFTRSIPLLRSLHWLPVRFRILFKINLFTYKTPREKQPVYLHFMLSASLPSHSLRSNNNNSLSVPMVKTNTGARAFHFRALSLGTTSCCLSVQSIQLLPLWNIWRHISLAWPFPHRYRHAWWPVDVMELFLKFCCWRLIQLSDHWARLRCHYRSLIDCLKYGRVPAVIQSHSMSSHSHTLSLVNKLPFHVPTVLLVTGLTLPIIIYQSLYWLHLGI